MFTRGWSVKLIGIVVAVLWALFNSPIGGRFFDYMMPAGKEAHVLSTVLIWIRDFLGVLPWSYLLGIATGLFLSIVWDERKNIEDHLQRLRVSVWSGFSSKRNQEINAARSIISLSDEIMAFAAKHSVELDFIPPRIEAATEEEKNNAWREEQKAMIRRHRNVMSEAEMRFAARIRWAEQQLHTPNQGSHRIIHQSHFTNMIGLREIGTHLGAAGHQWLDKWKAKPSNES